VQRTSEADETSAVNWAVSRVKEVPVAVKNFLSTPGSSIASFEELSVQSLSLLINYSISICRCNGDYCFQQLDLKFWFPGSGTFTADNVQWHNFHHHRQCRPKGLLQKARTELRQQSYYNAMSLLIIFRNQNFLLPVCAYEHKKLGPYSQEIEKQEG
jgi:hypothetical protein